MKIRSTLKMQQTPVMNGIGLLALLLLSASFLGIMTIETREWILLSLLVVMALSSLWFFVQGIRKKATANYYYLFTFLLAIVLTVLLYVYP